MLAEMRSRVWRSDWRNCRFSHLRKAEDEETCMCLPSDELASARLRSGNAIGLRLVAGTHVIERLVALGQEGMASGIDEAFDIDNFIKDARASA